MLALTLCGMFHRPITQTATLMEAVGKLLVFYVVFATAIARHLTGARSPNEAWMCHTGRQ